MIARAAAGGAPRSARRGVLSAAPPSRRRGVEGFTLLEVMIALAILSAGLLTISEIVGSSLRNHVRARQLDVATLLARGKMSALEWDYDRKGFRDFDEKDEGSFEEQGHPEIRWAVEVLKPQADLTPERILQLFAGQEGGLDALLQQLAPKSAGGPQQAMPGAAVIAQALQAQLTVVGEQVKKGVREVRLTVAWPDGKRSESFTVVTHMVVLSPREPGAM